MVLKLANRDNLANDKSAMLKCVPQKDLDIKQPLADAAHKQNSLNQETQKLISALAAQLNNKLNQNKIISKPAAKSPLQELKNSLLKTRNNNRLAKAKLMAAQAARAKNLKSRGLAGTRNTKYGVILKSPSDFNQLPGLRDCLKFIAHNNDDYSNPLSDKASTKS